MAGDNLTKLSKKLKELDDNEQVPRPCLNCKKVLYYPKNSSTALGVFNSFCSDTDCEDIYAFNQ